MKTATVKSLGHGRSQAVANNISRGSKSESPVSTYSETSLQYKIDNSPRMVAQRQQLRNLFGGIVMRKPIPGQMEANSDSPDSHPAFDMLSIDPERPVLQRQILEAGKSSSETDRPMQVIIIPLGFDISRPFNKWKAELGDQMAVKNYTFSDGDTVDDLAVTLGAHSVQLYTGDAKSGSLAECSLSAPLLNKGRYIVMRPVKAFSGLDSTDQPITAPNAVTLVTDLSSMLKQVSGANEVQAMMMGRSVVVSSNAPAELTNLQSQLGLSKSVTRTTVSEFINKLVIKYKDKYKIEIKFNQWDKIPVKDSEADAVATHFSGSSTKVVVKNTAADLTSLNSDLIIIYGHDEDTDTQTGDLPTERNFTWHAEQNLILALIHYLAFTTDDRENLSGIVLGGHKSACNVCKEVLPIIKYAIERLTNLEFLYAQKGNEDVHYNPVDAVSMVKAGKLHSQIALMLQSGVLEDDEKRLEEMKTAVQFAYQLKDSMAKFKTGEVEGIPSSEELEQEYKKKQMTPSQIISANNCLITAMNLGTEVEGDPLERIRNQVLGATNIPIGHPLIDDERVLRIIATVLNIRDRYYRINDNRFRVDGAGRITFLPEGFPQQVNQVHTIQHTPGIIGHFEYLGNQNLN